MAYSLLNKTKETDVCVFETEDRSEENIYDHVFHQVPDVVVGLGQWDISGENYAEQDLLNHLFHDVYVLWKPKTKRVEARGQYADSFDELKLKAFPTLRDRAPLNNKTLRETAFLISNNERNFTQFSTAETFLSYELSPEGAKLMSENFGIKGDYMQAINPRSYRTHLGKEYYVNDDSVLEDTRRPPNSKGMTEIVTELTKKVESGGGKIYRKETIASINKEGDKFLLQTTKSTVEANKTVITVGPAALKKISGDVIRNITDHQIFKSIVGVPAFYGAAVYDKAWWNDTTATQKNNNLQPLDKFISSSNCLGITMPYKGVGNSGRVVLHTIANNGGCSDKWGKLLEISKSNDVIDKELKRALKDKFQRNDIPNPVETIYKYWKEGFWYFQKPGANFNTTTIRQWARRPLTGHDVFLVNRAYYDFGGYLEYTIRSALEAVQEGWNSELPIQI